MVISFSNDIAWRQLVDHGEVVTFRKSRRKNPNGKTWCNRGRGQTKEFDVVIEEIGQAKPIHSHLEEYVSLSGFDDCYDWIRAIESLNGSKPEFGWLYRVKPAPGTELPSLANPV